MLTSFIIRTLFILGATLFVVLMTALIHDDHTCYEHRHHGTKYLTAMHGKPARYGFMLVTGSIALSILLTINSAL